MREGSVLTPGESSFGDVLAMDTDATSLGTWFDLYRSPRNSDNGLFCVYLPSGDNQGSFRLQYQ